jgi:hypothetical protein
VKTLKILCILTFFSNTVVSQKKTEIEIVIFRSDTGTVDSTTVFKVKIKNLSKKAITIPTQQFEDLYFNSYLSFFKIFFYHNVKDSHDTIGINNHGKLIHNIPIDDKSLIQKKDIIRLKPKSEFIYQFKFLKATLLEKGAYYYRLQFTPPSNVKVAQSRKFYYADFDRYEFDIVQ